MHRCLLVFVLAGCGTGGPTCFQQLDVDLEIAASTPQLQLRIESCRVDVDACPSLCTTAMADANIVGSFQHCTVTLDGSTAMMHVTYETESFESGCAVPGPVGDQP